MSLEFHETIGRAGIASLLTATLVIASLGSTAVLQIENAAASNVLFKEKIRDNLAVARKTITEGSTTTEVAAQAFTTISGDTLLCVLVIKIDESTNTFLTEFEACGPAQQLIVANGLGSATFSGTVTGFDFATGEEKTVTVNADLTATGKVETSTFGFHTNSRDVTIVFNSNGMNRPASGSLNIGGDITFSTDDASGTISKVKAGQIRIDKD